METAGPMFELSQTALAELAIRMSATAAVVVAVTFAVGRFGPLIGGALAGLPVVLAPGFYFMAREAPPEFVAEAAAYALWSLCGTQIFILSYMAAASRFAVAPSFLLSTAAWLAAAMVARSLPPVPVAGAAVYLAVTVLTRVAGSRLAGDTRRRGSVGGPGLLILRGLLAGLLVAVATGAAAYLGAGWSGILLAYPVGFTVVAVTLHERLGAAQAIGTLHAALLGTASLATFSALLAVLGTRMPILTALAVAVIASCLLAAALVLRSRRFGR